MVDETLAQSDVLILHTSESQTYAQQLYDFLTDVLGDGVMLGSYQDKLQSRFALVLMIDGLWSEIELQETIRQAMTDDRQRVIPVLVNRQFLPATATDHMADLQHLTPAYVSDSTWQDVQLERIASAIKQTTLNTIVREIEEMPAVARTAADDPFIPRLELPEPAYLSFTMIATFISAIAFGLLPFLLPGDISLTDSLPGSQMILAVASSVTIGLIFGLLYGHLWHTRLPEFGWHRVTWGLLYGLLFGVIGYAAASANLRIQIVIGVASLILLLLIPCIALWLPFPPRWHRFSVRIVWQVPIIILIGLFTLILGAVMGGLLILPLTGFDFSTPPDIDIRLALTAFATGAGIMQGLIGAPSLLAYYRIMAVKTKPRGVIVVDPIRSARAERRERRRIERTTRQNKSE